MRKVLFAVLLLGLTVLLFAKNFDFQKEKPISDTRFSLHSKDKVQVDSKVSRIVVVINPSKLEGGTVIMDALVDLSGGNKAEINAHIHGKIK